MRDDPVLLLTRLAITLPVFMFSLVIHEVAHGWMAKRFGDPTAEQAGRLTLDPRAHIDPLGLVMFIIASLSGIGFGWAKPVPVSLGNCRQPLRAMFWISAAGPLSNLLQAAVAALGLVILKLAGVPAVGLILKVHVGLLLAGEPLGFGMIVAAVLSYYLVINLVLMLFNLIPFPPLDGGRIAVSVLPYSLARPLAQVEPYGFVILLLLLQLGVTRWVVGWPLVHIIDGLSSLLI